MSLATNPFLPTYLSALVFFIGLFGFLSRKNILVILMSLELMLNAVSLNVLSLARAYGLKEGILLMFFIMTLAAAAAGVGLALAVRVYKVFKHISLTDLKGLKE